MICLPILALACLQHDHPQAPPAKTSPFQADDALRRLLGGAAVPNGATRELPLPDDARALPAMRVCAIVKMASKSNPAAIVDVEGVGTFSVHAGETLSFSRASRSSALAPAGEARHDGSPAAAAYAPVQRREPQVVLIIDKVGLDGVRARLGTGAEIVVIR